MTISIFLHKQKVIEVSLNKLYLQRWDESRGLGTPFNPMEQWIGDYQIEPNLRIVLQSKVFLILTLSTEVLFVSCNVYQ